MVRMKLLLAFCFGYSLSRLFRFSSDFEGLASDATSSKMYHIQSILAATPQNKTTDSHTTTLQGQHDISETPFRDMLERFRWDDAQQWNAQMWQDMIWRLLDFVYMEPLVPINETCVPPPLPDIDCAKYSPTAGFDPIPRTTPARLGHAINLGFDADALEIHLNEVYDIVDKFFIIEWTKSHHEILSRKPLTWENIKRQARFRKFQDKIVHFILDDAESAQILNETKLFTQEHYQTKRRWEKIVQWNNKTNFFGPDDVIGMGDADEIPARANVQLFKHCHMRQPRVDVGIWFPLKNISYAYCPTYIPIRGHPCSFGDPTFWKFQAAFNTSLYLINKWSHVQYDFPDRMWGTSGPYLLGGMHMSSYNYLPMIMLKKMTGTEMRMKDIQKLPKVMSHALSTNNLTAYEAMMSQIPGHVYRKTKLLSNIDPRKTEKIVYLPWFYDCNRERYPRWEDKPDSRLGKLDR